MADVIQIRRDTAANWTSADPTLAQGEIGYETDTGLLKIGDGSTAWISLAYFSSGVSTHTALTDMPSASNSDHDGRYFTETELTNGTISLTLLSLSDGTATLTGGSLTNVKLGSLTSNGLVKTSGGDGTISVDTTDYLDETEADLLYLKLDTSNDPLTGTLTINPADNTSALVATGVASTGGAKYGIDFQYTLNGEFAGVRTFADRSTITAASFSFSLFEIAPSFLTTTAGGGSFSFLTGILFGPTINTATGTLRYLTGFFYAPILTAGTVLQSYGIFIQDTAGSATSEIGGHFSGDEAAVQVGSGAITAVTVNGRWFQDGKLVLGASGMLGTETLRVIGDSILQGDVRLFSDSDRLIFGTGQDVDMYYDGTDFFINSDLINPSDILIDCGTEKTIELQETVWEDARIPIGGMILGATPPTVGTFFGSVSVLLFTVGNDDEVYLTIQIPHGYTEGTDIVPHVHWAPTTTNTGNVFWSLEYQWQNVGQAFAGASTTIQIADAGNGVIGEHQVATFPTITGTGKLISSMLCCRLYRNGTSGSDTYTGSAALLEFDIHFEKNTMGSRQQFIK